MSVKKTDQSFETTVKLARTSKAHQWVDVGWKEKDHPLGSEERRCSRCGAKQTMHREYWWGRVQSRKWMPLVGRCKPVDADNLTSVRSG